MGAWILSWVHGNEKKNKNDVLVNLFLFLSKKAHGAVVSL